MTSDEAIAFLKAHQPMPSDYAISEEDGSRFAAILKHFESHPDARCVPLLIRSVSPDTGLGMYEHIKFVFFQHTKEDVVPHLRHALKTGSDAQKARCCWWATDIAAWELRAEIEGFVTSNDEDLRDAAEAFLELRK
jgi:hypothetical protein